MKKVLFRACLIVVFFTPLLSWAEIDSIYADYDWTLQLGYGFAGSKVTHTETSSLSTFAAHDNSTSVDNGTILLRVLKEFMGEKSFSISVNAAVGMVDGSGDVASSLGNYKEEADGMLFGGGVSANLNYESHNMRIQPYLGFDVLIENLTYDLRYFSGGNTIETTYDYSGTFADISVGVRLLDPEVELMSFLAVSYLNALSEEISSSVMINGAQGDLQDGLIEKNPLKISLGFGFMF